MTSSYASAQRPFGRILTAMVTPFRSDGELDLDSAQKLANHLVDNGNDGLVVSGTTGESPTMNPDEDGRLLAAVLEAVGDRATVVAGVGNNDTQASSRLARQAKSAGAHGLLLVSPYYNKPPQAGLVRHFAEVTEAGDDVPVLLYDIPGRAGVRISHDTYEEVAKDSRIVGVKDAVGDLASGAWVMDECGLALYSGDDALNLAWLAVGAAGMVSTCGHVGARKYAEMADAIDKGDLATARRVNFEMLPVVSTIMDPVTQGAIMCKAALELKGLHPNRRVRSPLVDATDTQVETLRGVLSEAGLL